jgi:hypothetical protein
VAPHSSPEMLGFWSTLLYLGTATIRRIHKHIDTLTETEKDRKAQQVEKYEAISLCIAEELIL